MRGTPSVMAVNNRTAICYAVLRHHWPWREVLIGALALVGKHPFDVIDGHLQLAHGLFEYRFE